MYVYKVTRQSTLRTFFFDVELSLLVWIVGLEPRVVVRGLISLVPRNVFTH